MNLSHDKAFLAESLQGEFFFDQGMGYWRINFASKWYNFYLNDNVCFRSGNMALGCKEGSIVNSEENRATDVLVEVIAS